MKERLPTRDNLTTYFLMFVLVAGIIALVVILTLPSSKCGYCFSPTGSLIGR